MAEGKKNPYDIIEDERFRLTPARFRVQGHTTGIMHDICDSEIYIKDPGTMKWERMFPNRTFVRDGNNLRWIPITCGYVAEFDEYCSSVSSTSCNGSVTDPDAGSGDGSGSRGLPFDLASGYPEGYDMPDAGRGGFGVFSVPKTDEINSPVGLAIQRPVLNLTESYDSHGRSANNFLAGKYDTPSRINSNTYGRGAAITETVYELPKSTGYYELVYAAYSGISIDVYYLGNRIATTCGKVPEMTRSLLQFRVDPVVGSGESRIMIRVRGDEGCKWALAVLDVQSEPLFETLDNDDPEDYADIIENLFNDDDFVRERYLGTPLFPAPCHATVGNLSPENNDWRFRGRVESYNYFEYVHYIGDVPGRIVIDFDTWDTKDRIEVYYNGLRLGTTNHYVDGKGYIEFMYDPIDGVHDLMVRVLTEDSGRGDNLSSWYYTIFCPDTRGHRRDPWLCACLEENAFNCEDHYLQSMGHPAAEDNFSLDNGVTRGIFKVEVSNVSHATTVKVFNEDGTLIVQGSGTSTILLEAFNFDADTGQQYKNVYVRVETELGGSWGYTVYCPEPLIDIELIEKESGPVISIADLSIIEGETKNLVISLDRVVDTATSFRLKTVDKTAIEGVDYCGIDEYVTVPAGQTQALIPFQAAPCGGVQPPDASWQDAPITAITDDANNTYDYANASILVGNGTFSSRGREVAYVNDSTANDSVTTDTSGGLTTLKVDGRTITRPSTDGIKDWRVTVLSGTLSSQENVGVWTNQLISAVADSVAGSGVTNTVSVKVEFRYSDNSILSQDVTLMASTNRNPNTGGGGGGCVIWDNMVTMSDGTEKKAQHVRVGDVIRGKRIANLPDSSTSGSAYLHWAADHGEMDYEEVDVTVTFVDLSSYTSYYLINDHLGLTYQHPALVLSDGVYMFKQAIDIAVGDYLVKDLNVLEKVETLIYVEKLVPVVDIDVEDSDTYYMNGVLLHNVEIGDKQKN